MTLIKLNTEIDAPIDLCFDLSRSIDFHAFSMSSSGEKPVSGVTTGLIGLNETITWRAKHFGITQRLTSKISELVPSEVFTDIMISGPFKSIVHTHNFAFENKRTIMTDCFLYEVPYGIFGNLFDLIFLRNYMRKLLSGRNAMLKNALESEEWKKFINPINYEKENH